MAMSFRQKIGHVSWILFVFAIETNSLGRRIGMTILHELIAIIFAVVGLIVAVMALFVLRNGRRLLPAAVVGLLLNGGLLLIGLSNFLSAYLAARGKRE